MGTLQNRFLNQVENGVKGGREGAYQCYLFQINRFPEIPYFLIFWVLAQIPKGKIPLTIFFPGAAPPDPRSE